MNRIAISSGHGGKVAGAGGFIQEVAEARRVVPAVASYLKAAKATVLEFHENNATSQSANVNAIIAWHNAQTRDLDVSVHFNHSGGGNVDRAIGTEVLFVTQQALAARVSKAMSDASGLINRGAKKRTDLSFLNKTTKPAILLEVCFVNSRADVDLYNKYFDGICQAIASAITGKTAAQPVPEPKTRCPQCGHEF